MIKSGFSIADVPVPERYPITSDDNWFSPYYRYLSSEPSPGEQTDKVCSQTTSCGPDYKDTGVKFMLRVLSAEPTQVVLYHTYTAPGLYSVAVDVSAEYLPGDTDINMTEVLVQEKIADIIIISPQYNNTGSEVLFKLEPHKGQKLVQTTTTLIIITILPLLRLLLLQKTTTQPD